MIAILSAIIVFLGALIGTILYARKKTSDAYHDELDARIDAAIATDPGPVPIEQPTLQDALYTAAKNSLGKTMKLDPSVANLYACASSLSGVLKLAGVEGLPKTGIAGTAALEAWLAANPAFQRISQGAPGDIIISPSPASPEGQELEHGHCGVIAQYGILSNDSDTGKWAEKWTLPEWVDYYGTYGRLPVVYYRWTGE